MKSHCPSTANKSNHTRAQKEQIDTELEAEHKQSVPTICNSVRCDGGNLAAHRLTDRSPSETQYRGNEKRTEREKSIKDERLTAGRPLISFTLLERLCVCVCVCVCVCECV